MPLGGISPDFIFLRMRSQPSRCSSTEDGVANALTFSPPEAIRSLWQGAQDLASKGFTSLSKALGVAAGLGVVEESAASRSAAADRTRIEPGECKRMRCCYCNDW
jgi:hypothetical protein